MGFQSARDRVWRELANEASRDRLRLLMTHADAPGPPLGLASDDWHRERRLIAAGLVLERKTAPKTELICAPFVAQFLRWMSDHVLPQDFDALGTPTNRRILDALLRANPSVSELCSKTALSDSAVRAGLRELQHLNLVVAVQGRGRGRAWAAARPEVIVDLLNGGDLIAASACQHLARDFQPAMVERSGWPRWMAEEVLPSASMFLSSAAQDATDLAWLSLRRAFAEREHAPKSEEQTAATPEHPISASDAYGLGQLWWAIGYETMDRIASRPTPYALRAKWSHGEHDKSANSVSAADPRDRCARRWYWAYASNFRKRFGDPLPSDWTKMQLPTVEWGAVSAPFAATFDSAANHLTIDPACTTIDAALDPSDDHPEARQLIRDDLQLRLITHITTAELFAAGSDLDPPGLDDGSLTVKALGSIGGRAQLQRRVAASTRRLKKQHPIPPPSSDAVSSA